MARTPQLCQRCGKRRVGLVTRRVDGVLVDVCPLCAEALAAAPGFPRNPFCECRSDSCGEFLPPDAWRVAGASEDGGRLAVVPEHLDVERHMLIEFHDGWTEVMERTIPLSEDTAGRSLMRSYALAVVARVEAQAEGLHAARERGLLPPEVTALIAECEATASRLRDLIARIEEVDVA